MTHSDPSLWTTKLYARLHDPVEKPLVLMRIPGESHENGTSATLRRELFGSAAIPAPLVAVLNIADRWASAADRPNFPRTERTAANGQPILNPVTGEALLTADWANVSFAREAELIHPLSGHRVALQDISDIGPQQIKDAALTINRHLLHAARGKDGTVDGRLANLALWRFSNQWTPSAAEAARKHGAHADLDKLSALWSLLPADTRTPDHTIWQHLDLASAFAGALHGGEEPALLAMSIGPVQDFIAASRSTSDLWAGSHLLSRIAWEGMRVICEALGPEALLMPQLRGVPQVDLWLLEQGLPAELFGDAEWLSRATDANPLFAAALPNKWLAIVPAARAEALAEACQRAMRDFVHNTGRRAYEELLKVADLTDAEGHGYEQVRQQLAQFPELHWAMVPWSLAGAVHESARADVEALDQALSSFYPADGETPPFTRSHTFRALTSSGDIELEGVRFWAPNPGLLYPALHDLVERALAAAKSLRPFSALDQHGYRCSLTGESEWLTPDRELLAYSTPEGEKLWTRVAAQRPAWARSGERLGALATLKRLWPTLFLSELQDHAQLEFGDMRRFVVSTHAMAMASPLVKIQQQASALSDEQQQALDALLDRPASSRPRVALPRKLARLPQGRIPLEKIARLPGLLDDADESELSLLRGLLKKLFNGSTPEAYYGLLLMDGDRMGAWISGQHAIAIRDTFHSRVRNHLVEQRIDALQTYLGAHRPVSPSYHMAISGALNRFSVELARLVVEDTHLGRLLYAGGDDVMAMTSVSDLLSTCVALRCIYSGAAIPGQTLPERMRQSSSSRDLQTGNGFAMLDGQLTRMMGTALVAAPGTDKAPQGFEATASTGAVIAHHMAPLGAVLRELRTAEKNAKNAGGRNAFSLTVIKRSGGALHLTLPWGLSGSDGGPLLHLEALAQAMKLGSRRAVFNIMQWVKDLNLDAVHSPDMLQPLLAYQFSRQGITPAAEHTSKLLNALTLYRQTPGFARLATHPERNGALADFIYNYLSVADFLAREERGGTEDSA